ncbi:uncharacterized protein I206_103579 [Kwoniella pini CBS 10737]|uniref:Zn(2)-C6 fungal-type domain-containing protein n=1 Tax=Kwoniella pini CBS 10737 TaxID=1296096 RepID=A0A1B9I9R2_9TREE|nr:uncharacterized protein I206_01416 [Kwoniella pini CBS 10737]OCF52131.1 hypothetical protein I206_01416 [Kwoniella pini CBS 10737]
MTSQASFKRRKDGCRTCRQRRVKCDRDKPSCGHCQRLSLVCRWPELIDTFTEDGPSRPKRQQTSRKRIHASRSMTTNDRSSVQLPENTRSTQNSTKDVAEDSLDLPNAASSSSSVQQDVTSFTDTSPPDLPGSNSGNNQASFDPVDQSLFNFNSGNYDQHNTKNAFDQLQSFADVNEPLLADINFDLFFGLNDPFAATFPTITGLDLTGNLQNNAPFNLADFSDDLSGSRRSFCTPVLPDAVDQRIATYFLETVSDGAITRQHNTPNYYISLFAASLFCPSLYAGMLAWSAWHMATTVPMDPTARQECLNYADRKYRLCGELLFQNLEFVNTDSETDLEAVYCSFMVYGQYGLVTCVPLEKLRHLLNEVDKMHQSRPLDSKSSPLLQRMASILALYDMKTSLFGLSEPLYTLHLGAAIFNSPETTVSTGAFSSVSSLHMLYLSAQSTVIEGRLREAREDQDVIGVRRILRLGDELYERICSIDKLLDPSKLDLYVDELHPIDENPNPVMTIQQQSINHDIRFEIMLACMYHGVVIQLSRILNYPTPIRSIDRTISMTLNLTRRDPMTLHGVLSLPIFFAGLETKDTNKYQEILEWFDTNNTGVNGAARVQNTRYLLEEVKKAESDGQRKDVGQIMRRTKLDTLV